MAFLVKCFLVWVSFYIECECANILCDHLKAFWNTLKIQNFDPRSEDPNVELGGNLTTNEYQGQSDYVSQKLGIGDLQVDQADSLEKMRATIKFYNNTEFESDPTSATLISSAGNYVTLDTSLVPDNLISNLTIDNSTPGQFIIDVTPTTSGGVVTTSSVDNLKTIMSNIGVLPPIDYSTNSGDDIRVQIQVQAKETGAEFSAPSGGDFTLIVNPVAAIVLLNVAAPASDISKVNASINEPPSLPLILKSLSEIIDSTAA